MPWSYADILYKDGVQLHSYTWLHKHATYQVMTILNQNQWCDGHDEDGGGDEAREGLICGCSPTIVKTRDEGEGSTFGHLVNATYQPWEITFWLCTPQGLLSGMNMRTCAHRWDLIWETNKAGEVLDSLNFWRSLWMVWNHGTQILSTQRNTQIPHLPKDLRIYLTLWRRCLHFLVCLSPMTFSYVQTGPLPSAQAL